MTVDEMERLPITAERRRRFSPIIHALMGVIGDQPIRGQPILSRAVHPAVDYFYGSSSIKRPVSDLAWGIGIGDVEGY